jgi:adenylate cyclase
MVIELMRSTLQRCNGYEVKTEGDSFMVAFSSTVDACKWCLTVQQQLLQVNWPQALYTHKDAEEQQNPQGELLYKGLRVRMGMHTGVPTCKEDPITKRMDVCICWFVTTEFCDNLSGHSISA